MTEPNQAMLDDETVPRILIAGKNWPVPMMAPKQNKIIVPAVLRAVPKILSAGDGKGKFDLTKFAAAMDEATYSDLLKVVYVALTRAHPTLGQAEFDDMPIPTMELVLACLVIATQTGVIKAGGGTTGDVKLGEAAAGSSQTGTP